MRYLYLHSVLAIVLLAGVSGCSAISGLGAKPEGSGQRVPLPEIPAPARVTIEKLIAGGQIRVLMQKEIDGHVVYHVEAKVGQEDVAYDVAGDGTVLTAGEAVAYASLPAGVLAAARKCSGSVARGGVCNDVEGKKKGNAVATLKLRAARRIIAKETA